MLRFVILLAISALLCAGRPSEEEEDLPVLGVIGGDFAAPGQFPFQISIEINQRQHCGGALIALDKVLTAAHCVHGIDIYALTVLAGTHNRLIGGQRARVKSYRPHERYDPSSQDYDIAIIELEAPFSKSPTVGVATLPNKGELLLNNEVGTISGWGAEYHQGPISHLLRYVTIPLWSIDYCRQVIPILTHTHLCAGDISGQRNSCFGDSGGPLTQGNKIIGVVSSGFGCGAIYQPALYTYVAGVRDWIRANAGI